MWFGFVQSKEKILKRALESKKIKQFNYVHWLRAKLSFNLLRSAVLCLRGSRTIKQEVNYDINNIEILNEIGRIV
jgi:hypothetical protein